MSEAVIADRQPASLELDPGTYYWCSCGRSRSQPFCDGSHEGTGHQPVSFELTERRTVYLCQCKHSKNAPYCDGSHQGL